MAADLLFGQRNPLPVELAAELAFQNAPGVVLDVVALPIPVADVSTQALNSLWVCKSVCVISIRDDQLVR